MTASRSKTADRARSCATELRMEGKLAVQSFPLRVKSLTVFPSRKAISR